jgi:AcrR family transcriptional regulator
VVRNDAALDEPRRGRPRSERARQAILVAATELLLAGDPTVVSMDAVAERAQVSKATIYRWWPSKEMLALEALFENWLAAASKEPDTGTLRGDVLAIVTPWVRELGRRPSGPVLTMLISEAQRDPAFATVYRETFVEPRRAPMRAAFARAIERGEISPKTDVEVVLDLIYGAIYHRLLHGHLPFGMRFAQKVVDAALPDSL